MTLLTLLNQNQPTPQKLFEWVTNNAFDFLETGIKEFQEKPKYSVIHFCTGVELFLKARLMKEHWSLIVRDTNKADWNDFISGKCATVNLEECFSRLEKIANEKISQKTIFAKLASHRNQIIHFHHELNHNNKSIIADIAKEQCKAWQAIKKLLTEQWKSNFPDIQPQIHSLEIILKQQQKYLEIVYAEIQPEIEKEIEQGQKYQDCPACSFKSMKLITLNEIPYIYAADCQLCHFNAGWFMEFDCPQCKEVVAFSGSDTECDECNEEYDLEKLKKMLSTTHQGMRNSDISATAWEFNCSDCLEELTVIEHEGIYICLSCLKHADSVVECAWCQIGNLGLKEDEDCSSYVAGCSHCEGSVGYQLSKDD